jgi:DNA-binding IclR family transcriptional regulator
MAQSSGPSSNGPEADAGPRAILRVPEVLMALAAKPAGSSLAELSPALGVPKTSLHRLLRTLERGGYLTSQGGIYRLGPTSFHLASLIGRSAPASAFPASAHPTIEWLARETLETVMLGVLSGDEPEVLYVDVIDSEAPVRFSVPIGDRRPLYCAASGQALLAFLPRDAQHEYLRETEFTQFTPFTRRKEDLPELLQKVRSTGVAFDESGKITGASGIASPIFDREGAAFASVSVAGPSERMETNRARLEPLVRSAGERISRLLGYGGDYPPQ